jgi:dihydroorotase
MIYVDPHVHGRDGEEESDKETVEHLLQVARDSGVVAVFEMSNPKPPLTTEKAIRDRIELGRRANVREVFHGLYFGITADRVQVRDMVRVHRKYQPHVVGGKLFMGHSTNNLGVITEEEQFGVIEELTQQGYEGILTVHPEKESYMHPKVWNPSHPVSHCMARPPQAEVESVKDILRFVQATGFRGKLNIAHISVPESVELVVAAKHAGVDVACGVCPHHLIYDMGEMLSPTGILLKMNPPLRMPGDPDRMVEYLRTGAIDWMETDHAPHTYRQKTESGFLSGIPGLPWWDLYAEFLRTRNFTEDRIRAVTSEAVLQRFKLDVPLVDRPRTYRGNDYAFHPYEALERKLLRKAH